MTDDNKAHPCSGTGLLGGMCEAEIRELCDSENAWRVVGRFRNIETAAKPGSDVEALWREQHPDETLPDWAWVATVEWKKGAR
jgi:hypothetical protein